MKGDVKLLTVNDVAEALQMAPYTVRQYLRTAKIKGFHLGGDGPWRVHPADLERFVRAPKPNGPPRPRSVSGRFAQQGAERRRTGARSG